MTSAIQQKIRPDFFRNLSFYSFLALWPALTFSSAISEIAYVTASVSWILWHALSRTPLRLPSRSVLIPLGLFCAGVLLSAVTSEYFSNSVQGIWKISKQVFIFLIGMDLLREESMLKKFEVVFWATAWLVLADCASQYFFGKDFLRFKPYEDSGAGIRLTGSFGTYGKLASHIITAFPLLAALVLKGWRQWGNGRRISSLVLVAGYLAILFLTKSRGAILAFLLGTAVILLMKQQYKIFLGLVVAAGIAVSLLPHNMVIHLDADRKEQSIVERLDLWGRAIDVIKAKPLTGTGINTYSSAHAKYDKGGSTRVQGYYAHNGYLQLGAETGIPCLLAFLWFLATYLWEAFKFPPSGTDNNTCFGLLGGILNFLFFIMVDTAFQSPQPVITFWYCLGLQSAFRLSAGEFPTIQKRVNTV